MRALLAILILLTAGCVAPGLTKTSVSSALEVPKGATATPIPGGVRVLFDAAKFPFAENLTIPAGTTLVRATGLVGKDDSISVSMRNADTGRRRCNFAPLDAWDASLKMEGSCSGVAMVDALPAVWQVRGASSAKAGKVQVDLLTTPIDGPLAKLDTSQISLRTHKLKDTTVQMLPSWDGTPLRVEVTLPEGPGPWPTIISSSPYNEADRAASGKPAMWAYFTQDWAERGYAVINADVRGFGESGGCVEVWGIAEQKDQSFLVDWAAKQPWSDGKVGFYGQSYVATTPVEAAVQAPAALKAIIAVAPVVDSYNDWHFGGVPNGEDYDSPLEYQTLGGGAPFPSTDPLADLPTDPAYLAARATNGFCDPTLEAKANDPRALYDSFYEERNFSARAKDVKAAVLYTEGFEDSNVKSAEIPDWFNALTAPKLGLFGHWIHQHPTRADNEALFLLWFDQFLKGKPVGFEKLSPAYALSNDGHEVALPAWPPINAPDTLLHADLAGGKLSPAQGAGSATLWMDAVRGTLPISLAQLPLQTRVELVSDPLSAPLLYGGQGRVLVDATLQNAENAYVAAYLYEEKGETQRLVSWGMYNLAHRDGHDKYEPVQPGERVHVGIPLLPTEWTFPAGAKLHLLIRGAAVNDWDLVKPGEPAQLTLYAEGTALALPAAPAGEPLPSTAQR